MKQNTHKYEVILKKKGRSELQLERSAYSSSELGFVDGVNGAAWIKLNQIAGRVWK